jgi:hypothetical protein
VTAVTGQEVLQRPILMGRKCIAEYIDPLVPEYQGNPLIESLPQVYEPEQVSLLLTEHPTYTENQRNWPLSIRMHCIEQIAKFMQPLPEHIRLEQALSRLIRVGYEARNPLDASHARQFAIGFKEIRDSGLNDRGENIAGVAPTSLAFTLLGVSGIGKSTAINRILKLYPQVIQHVKYREHQLILKQLVWLKLECPASGSLKVLCQNFFRQIDLVLGTNCYKEHVKSHSTKETMLDPMAQIAARQGLGVLVIDEIQRLRLAKNGGEQEVLAYLTEFVNTIGVPVVLIGTYQSLFLFKSTFAEARRSTGQVDPIWSRMENGPTWRFFMEQLWQFQWTRKKCPLTEDLLEKFYEESQGITDIAVKLYKAAQWEAISDGSEEISTHQVSLVAEKYLRLVHPLLHALRTGDEEKICSVPDLKPDWETLNDYLKENGPKMELQGMLAKEHARILRQKEVSGTLLELINIGTELGMAAERAQIVAEQVIQASKGMGDPGLMKKQMAIAALENEIGHPVNQTVKEKRISGIAGKVKPLVAAHDPWKPVLDALANRTSIHEALQDVGFLKPPSPEFNL